MIRTAMMNAHKPKRGFAVCLSLAGLLSSCTHPVAGYSAENESNTQTSKTRIVMLGTGTPNADPDRAGSAVAIVVNGVPYLIDCGPGVIRRAAAAHRAGIEALEVSKIRRLFVTHLHSDHTIGYPDVILTPWVLERRVPLKVFGPPGIQAMTDHILKAYEEDIHIRTEGTEPANAAGYMVDVHEIKQPGIVYTDANVTVRAFPVKHGAWKYAFGFRFDTPDRSIVISGDTVPTPTLIDIAKGCDVLIHEVYSESGFNRREPEWQHYHSTSHTSTRQLAEIAQQTKPGLLILYHQLFWGTTEEDLLNEIRQHYPGPVTSAHDLDVYEYEKRGRESFYRVQGR